MGNVIKTKTADAVHKGFEIGLLLKFTGGVLEFIGAGLLVFLTPDRLDDVVRLITQHELLSDPNDLIANMLLTFSRNFSVNSQLFGIFYLATHGIIKIVLVYFLWRKKLWAYPLAIAVLILFTAYQIYRINVHFTVFMLFLTLLDIAMIILTWLEYKRVKAQKNKGLPDS